jgi:hypothetical protein
MGDKRLENSNRTTRWLAAAVATALLLGGTLPALAQQTKAADDLYQGMTRTVKVNIETTGERRHVKNTRGMPFGGAAVIVGTGRNERAHVYTATGCSDFVPGSIEKIDVKALAPTFGSNVKAVVPNAGRHWTMDEITLELGEVVAFQGVKLCWGGDMSGDEIKANFSGNYSIGKILRNSEWIYKAGSKVQLLREPGGIVWVMQEYTKTIDPTLTIDNLDTVGGKLKNLPEGWTFETKVLDKDLTLDTRRTGLWASIIRDELGNTYQGTGFDDMANYVP